MVVCAPAVENQTHVYRAVEDHFAAVVDRLLDTVIEQKRSNKTFVDVKTAFDRSRLPVVYHDEA